jgi:hypothetical protein
MGQVQQNNQIPWLSITGLRRSQPTTFCLDDHCALASVWTAVMSRGQCRFGAKPRTRFGSLSRLVAHAGLVVTDRFNMPSCRWITLMISETSRMQVFHVERRRQLAADAGEILLPIDPKTADPVLVAKLESICKHSADPNNREAAI